MDNKIHKDWLKKVIGEVALESGKIDKIEEISNPSFLKTYVHGWKNEQKVLLKVWFNDELEDFLVEKVR